MFYPDKNFINTLSNGERFIFLKIICGTVAANRQVSREELLYLKEAALKYEVSGESLANMIKSSDRTALMMQARMITDRAKALMLIKDMCMVANIDSSLEDSEIDYILTSPRQCTSNPNASRKLMPSSTNIWRYRRKPAFSWNRNIGPDARAACSVRHPFSGTPDYPSGYPAPNTSGAPD